MKKDEVAGEEKWQQNRWRRRLPLRGPLALVIIVLILWLCFELRALLVALLFSLTLASAIAPVAEKFQKKWQVSRTLTVLAVYVIVGVAYSFLVAALFPTLKEQALSLYQHLPSYADGINNLYNHIRELLGENADSFKIGSSEIKAFMSRVTGHAVHFTTDLVTVIATAILVMFLTAYFVIEADDIWPKVLSWLPRHMRQRAAGIIRPLESRLGGYIRGQLLVCCAVSVFLSVGLTLLQVEHGLLLGALSGLLNLVPFVGSMITAVLAILVAFNQSPWLAAAVAGLFAVEQWIESNIIVPKVLGKQVELHPLIVLFAILIGATLMGVPGALIAVPVATAGVFLAEEFYWRPLQKRESDEVSEELKKTGEGNQYESAAAILSESGTEEPSESSHDAGATLTASESEEQTI